MQPCKTCTTIVVLLYYRIPHLLLTTLSYYYYYNNDATPHKSLSIIITTTTTMEWKDFEAQVEQERQFLRVTETDRRLLAYLLTNPQQHVFCNLHNLANRIARSQSSVALSLRKLKELGIVRKSPGGAWFIPAEQRAKASLVLSHKLPKLKLKDLEK